MTISGLAIGWLYTAAGGQFEHRVAQVRGEVAGRHRDFAFVVAEDVPAESLLSAVRGAEKGLIREVTLFDVYAGAGLGEGQKSLAVAVRLQAADHTLTEAEIEAVAKKITTAAR